MPYTRSDRITANSEGPGTIQQELFTSTAAFLWDEVVAPLFQRTSERPKLLDVLLFLPWYCWTIGLLVLLVVLIHQHAYELIHAAEDRAEMLDSRSKNVGVRDWIGEWGKSERQFKEFEKSDVFAELHDGAWAIRSDHDSVVVRKNPIQQLFGPM